MFRKCKEILIISYDLQILQQVLPQPIGSKSNSVVHLGLIALTLAMTVTSMKHSDPSYAGITISYAGELLQYATCTCIWMKLWI